MKKLIVIALAFASCTKSPVCPVPAFTLNGTKWVNRDNSKMVFKFKNDSLFLVGNDAQKGKYKATKNSMTLYFREDSVVFDIAVDDSVMVWVNYPLPNNTITFNRTK